MARSRPESHPMWISVVVVPTSLHKMGHSFLKTTVDNELLVRLRERLRDVGEHLHAYAVADLRLALLFTRGKGQDCDNHHNPSQHNEGAPEETAAAQALLGMHRLAGCDERHDIG